MARNPAKKKTWPQGQKEESREFLGANHSPRSRPPLQPERASDALGCGSLLHLFALYRFGALVAVAVLLDRCPSRRRSSYSNVAPLGRTHFFRRGLVHVCAVGATNEAHWRRPQVVESG